MKKPSSHHESTPLRQYFSRRTMSSRIPDLPVEDWVGIYSPWALLWGIIFLVVPFAYIYIVFILLRELCMTFPETIYQPIQTYVPLLARLIAAMQKSSLVVEVWCVIEAVFYLTVNLKIMWLQRKDPLEASLSAAPLMELSQREILWGRMMECEKEDPVLFLTGWFFDEPLESISKYDVRDFIAWSMFEGRHQEHLTTAEQAQLEDFVDELERRISLQLYGPVTNGDEKPSEQENASDETMEVMQQIDDAESLKGWRRDLAHPKKVFKFQEERHHEEPNFFTNLYESYRTSYEHMVKNVHPVQDIREMVGDFHPVQDFRNLVAETAQHIVDAEESAMAKGRQMYQTLVPSGSQMDKHLSAMGHATYTQLTEAWNSVKNMKERLETARFLSKQRLRIRQQLKGYRVMLNRMLETSSAIPSKQMASLMRRITECNEAMERLESQAQNAFVQATGFARKNLPFLHRKEPQRYAKYSSDPLLSIASYPLGFHLLLLGGTEIPLRVMMKKRGFERRTIGPVGYYFHPGIENGEVEDATEKTPIVFVHGIGIGLIVYMPLVDALLESGRPIFLPEIPYVSGFRPWQSPNAVLQPAVVASTMTAMLASHGYLRGAWMGHSYGTSWLSYMCKYASHAVAGVLFLDPICFCLHVPRLTKSFVYTKPDPGTIGYIIRTDLIVNWTIQRSFPWSWIIIFFEEIDVPCSVFLSEKDALVPSEKVEDYLRNKSVPVEDFDNVTEDHYKSRMNCTVFRGVGHGDWTERPSATIPKIGIAAEVICRQADQDKEWDR